MRLSAYWNFSKGKIVGCFVNITIQVRSHTKVNAVVEFRDYCDYVATSNPSTDLHCISNQVQ